MVKAIVFDFNGVFVKPVEMAVIAKACAIKGTGKWIALSNYYLNIQSFEKGFMAPEVFWKKVFRDLTNEEYACIVEPAYARPPEKNIPVFKIAERLSKKFDLYVFSNSNFLQGKEYRRHNLFAGFKKIFLSHELHSIKPFPGSFKKFLSETGLKAEECVFVDDKFLNTITAAALGFKGVHFKDEVLLEKQLECLGVEM